MQQADKAAARRETNSGPDSDYQVVDISGVTHSGISPWQVINALPAAIYVTDAKGNITYFNEAAAQLWGCRPKLHSDQWCGSWRLYQLDGTPLPHDQCPMAVSLKRGEPIRGGQAVAERPDGTRVPFLAFPTPLHDASGNLAGAVNMLVETTELRRAERLERRLAAIVETNDDAIVSKDLNGIIATWNHAAERLFGYLRAEVIGKPITILIPPDRLSEEDEILARTRRGERIDHFETVRQRKDGSLVNISLTISPVTDETGTVIGASKIARDITEQKRREDQIALLAREAEHRTKNLLALAQAAVHLAQGATPAELKEAIEGRLRALANAHSLLAKSRWSGADLRELVTSELSVYAGDRESRTEIRGPPLLLQPEPAQAMAVALHELTTNSIKYGALSSPSGRLRITWRRLPLDRFFFQWSESDGPAVKAPERQGFGTRVIERMIDGQLNGEANFHWNTSGLVCDIAFDL